LHGQDLPAWLEAGIVISGTAATCILTYEIIRRVTILRPLFGLRMGAQGEQPAGVMIGDRRKGAKTAHA
jgi:hypothetical protein